MSQFVSQEKPTFIMPRLKPLTNTPTVRVYSVLALYRSLQFFSLPEMQNPQHLQTTLISRLPDGLEHTELQQFSLLLFKMITFLKLMSNCELYEQETWNVPSQEKRGYGTGLPVYRDWCGRV